MPVTSSTFTDLYAPGLRKVIFEQFMAQPDEHMAFLNEASSTRQYEEDYRWAGFGTVPEKAEGTPIVYDEPVPDTTVRFSWTPYGKGIRMTHEAKQDELYGQFAKMAGAMGRAFKNQVQVTAATILDNAFTYTAGDGNGYDGKALCATDHPNLRTGNQRNRPSTFVDLSVTALQDALIDFERFTDHSGVPIVIAPKKLLVSPEDVPLAREILGSQFKPFTSDNEINVLANALQLVVSHYKTDTDSWFVLADKAETDLWLFWREKFTTDASDDFDTGDSKMKGYMRYGIGFGEWFGVWGSEGV